MWPNVTGHISCMICPGVALSLQEARTDPACGGAPQGHGRRAPDGRLHHVRGIHFTRGSLAGRRLLRLSACDRVNLPTLCVCVCVACKASHLPSTQYQTLAVDHKKVSCALRGGRNYMNITL